MMSWQVLEKSRNILRLLSSLFAWAREENVFKKIAQTLQSLLSPVYPLQVGVPSVSDTYLMAFNSR